MAYASASDVQARIPGRTIGASTKPSTAQVEAWLATAEARLVNTLASKGITGPFTGNGAEIMKEVICWFGEGRTRMAHASAGGDGTNDDGKDLVKQFEEALASIRENPGAWAGELQASSSPTAGRRIRSHVLDNTAGKLPTDFGPQFEKNGDQF